MSSNCTVFLCCGDILVDLFNKPSDSFGEVNLAGHVGGSTLNVAVGLARLGHSSAYFGKNSTDFIGQGILNYLKSNQVNCDWLLATKLNSTLAMIKKNADGSANYAFYTNNTADVSITEKELPENLSDSIDIINFGSYSTAVEPTASSLAHLAQRETSNRVISYDPNIRPTIEPDMAIWRDQFQKFSSVADFVKASDEDIELLFGAGYSFDAFASDLIASGAKAVAVTKGGKGANLYSADGRVEVSEPLSVNVADTVGAGDTFQAASLHWLNSNDCIQKNTLDLSQANLKDWVSQATRAAAITCTRHGANLPTLAELQAWS